MCGDIIPMPSNKVTPGKMTHFPIFWALKILLKLTELSAEHSSNHWHVSDHVGSCLAAWPSDVSSASLFLQSFVAVLLNNLSRQLSPNFRVKVKSSQEILNRSKMAADNAVFLHWLEKNYALCRWQRGFWIPILSGIRDSLSCILDSKAQDSGLYELIFPDSEYYKPKFPRFRIHLHGAKRGAFFFSQTKTNVSATLARMVLHVSIFLEVIAASAHLLTLAETVKKVRIEETWQLAVKYPLTEAQSVFNRLSFFQIHFLKSYLKSLFYIYRRVFAEVKGWKGDMERRN